MNKRDFIKTLGIIAASVPVMKLSAFSDVTGSLPSTKKMPVLFLGHGHPMNAIADNSFTQRLTKLGNTLQRPTAILILSAHWETRGTYVSTNPTPKAIYDFGDFDDRLFQVKYAPKGHPSLAKEVPKLLTSTTVKEHPTMGLDHGAWTVLKFLYPKADIPVFQMSIDYRQSMTTHFELGKQLAALRKKGVLIIGSGNIVHNLGQLDWRNINAKPHDWNVEFDKKVKGLLEKREFTTLVNYQKLGTSARLSIPTTDHYIPMIYTLGLATKEDKIQQLFEGYQYAGISMRCFQIG